jgi:hypothetical protein
MNERIFELAQQANEYATTRHPVSNIALSVNSEKFVKKFAELIVEECAELSVNSRYANTKSEYYEGFNEALIYVGNKIKRHFGVEE